MNSPAIVPEPWRRPWPSYGLEAVTTCPVCGIARRKILHENLVDKVFRVAAGTWQLWQCAGCGSAYLDPRPTPDTIHLAYADYYTHRPASKKETYASLRPLRKLRRRLVNGYTNRRFGTSASPASALGALLLPLFVSHRRRLDGEYRHLLKPPLGGGSFLEVGFGSGKFLKVAANCGWSVKGVDPDPAVVQAALAEGFDVQQGGIEDVDASENSVDVIMMNHVIEHLHYPIQALERSHLFLRPGGVLYIATPSIDGLGHRRFGRNWRDLDAPRHLVLFNSRSMRGALEKTGFCRIKWKARANPVTPITLASVAVRRNERIGSVMKLDHTDQLFIRYARLVQALVPYTREYITWTASKS